MVSAARAGATGNGGICPTVDAPQPDWFQYYSASFNSVEINASFYSWPTVASAQAWRRQPGGREFVYTVKVCELITHVKKFEGHENARPGLLPHRPILGDRMGCFLFPAAAKLPIYNGPSSGIVSQLDPERRNVVEFRHNSWWNEEVYRTFRKAGIDILLL